MRTKVAQLTARAKQIMADCTDPIHDLSHVERVVSYTSSIAKGYNLSAEQRDALLLAAWWHDVARTLTKNPSFVMMSLFDDTLSALMLWGATIKARLFGHVVGLSTRVILCKSLGTGAIFTRLLLKKEDRIILDILKDADRLDTFCTERTEQLQTFIEASKRHKTAYRVAVWWMAQSSYLHFRTKEARMFLKQLVKQFIAWLQQPHIFDWHVSHYGERWMDLFIARMNTYYYKQCSPA